MRAAARRRSKPLVTLVTAPVVAVGLLVLMAGPAGADTPEGWAPEPSISFWQFFLVLLVFPLLAFVVITVLVYAPSLAKGEPLKPGPREIDDQWLGGPRKASGELAGPDDEGSKAGGASGRW